MTHPLRALFLDMDSYFASVEQAMNPHLRGKPIGVAPMMTESTCCIAASYEAKAFGVKTGTGVAEARQLCPGIIIVEARPPLYVEVHHQVVEIVESCIHVDHVLSIDEMVCWLPTNRRTVAHVEEIGQAIKTKLREKFGDALGCSIGVAPNGWLAKVASKMRKPDGFFIIHAEELPKVLYELQPGDLHGIGPRMVARLHAKGIHTMEQLWEAPRDVLHAIWGGIGGSRLWYRLRGVVVDDHEESPLKRSISHGHVLPPEMRSPAHAIAVVHRLVQKAALRMRTHGLKAGAIDLSLRYTNREKWAGGITFAETSDSLFLTKAAKTLWDQRAFSNVPIQKANVILGRLVSQAQFTPSLFDQESPQQDALNKAMDAITGKFGKEALYLGGAHDAMKTGQAKIAFNHIPDIELES